MLLDSCVANDTKILMISFMYMYSASSSRYIYQTFIASNGRMFLPLRAWATPTSARIIFFIILISYFRNTDQLHIHVYRCESINVSRHTKRSYVAMGEPFLMSQITKQHPINDYTTSLHFQKRCVINLLQCSHQCQHQEPGDVLLPRGPHSWQL